MRLALEWQCDKKCILIIIFIDGEGFSRKTILKKGPEIVAGIMIYFTHAHDLVCVSKLCCKYFPFCF